MAHSDEERAIPLHQEPIDITKAEAVYKGLAVDRPDQPDPKDATTMLPELGPACDRSATGPAGRALLDRIRATFPALAIRSARLDQSGGDHLLLIINDEHAFRFPRAGMHDLRLEIEVLRQLRRRSPVAVPVYDHLDPAGRFGGYRFIAGEPLTVARFARLDEAGRGAVFDDTARFLLALHDLPQAEVAWRGDWPRSWTAAQFADRALTDRLPLIARHAPHLAAPIAAFHAAYRDDRADRLAIVHGDLVCDHLLVDRAGRGLAGVIDFGDVALGDPAQDLLGIWSYGRAAVVRVIARYDAGAAEPGLLHRSRNHFIRHLIDRLFEGLAVGQGMDEQVAMVEALLRREEDRQPG